MRNRVKELRKERKIHQSELASKINVSQQTISRIENGDNSLPADTLIDLSKFFGVSVDYILYLSDNRRTAEFQMEYQEFSERNVDLFRIYDRLSDENQALICKLAEQLARGQHS